MLSIFSKFNRQKQVQLPEACDVELPDASKAEEQFDSSPKRQLDGPFGPIPDVVTAIAEHLEPEHFTPALGIDAKRCPKWAERHETTASQVAAMILVHLSVHRSGREGWTDAIHHSALLNAVAKVIHGGKDEIFLRRLEPGIDHMEVAGTVEYVGHGEDSYIQLA